MLTKSQIETLKQMTGAMEQMSSDLSNIYQSAQDKFDGRSDKWRDSEAGDTASQLVADLDNVQSAAETLKDYLLSLELE